jgi:hypothetical protein
MFGNGAESMYRYRNRLEQELEADVLTFNANFMLIF